MRIDIEHIPLTEEVTECFMSANKYDEVRKALKARGEAPLRTASVSKWVDKKDVSPEFIEALKVILALPDSAGQPSVVGFS